MKKRGLCFALTALTLATVGMMTACGENNTVSGNQVDEAGNLVLDGSEEVITINGVEVSVAEYSLYLIPFATSMDLEKETAPDYDRLYALDTCITSLETDLTGYLKAKETGLTLSDMMTQNVDSYTGAFISYYGMDFLSDYGITEEMVHTYFERQAYAYAMKETVKAEAYDTAYAGYEDEYKDLTFQLVYSVYFPTIVTDENGDFVTDAEGNYTNLSEEEILQVEATAKNLLSETNDKSLEELAVDYGVSMYAGPNYLYDGGYGEEMKAYVEDLKNGDISDVIPMDVGYMIVRMDNANDAEYKQAMIAYLADTDATKETDLKLAEWFQEYGVSNKLLNTEVIASIDLSSLSADLKNRGLYQEGMRLN